jgi:predicted nucleic acid-binding protein
MTAKVFVDSNILVYAHDADAGPKQKIAAAQIRALWEHQSGRISTQVLQEWSAATDGKEEILADENERHRSPVLCS